MKVGPAALGEPLHFGEERRRTKVIPHAFGERAVLKLMYAALIRASQTWKRAVAKSACRSRISSRNGT
jgi:transposase-like protein